MTLKKNLLLLLVFLLFFGLASFRQHWSGSFVVRGCESCEGCCAAELADGDVCLEENFGEEDNCN